MQLTCPNCSTRYILAASALGPEGRQVRCANCGNEWFAEPPEPEEIPVVDFQDAPVQEPEPIPEAVRPIREGSSVPALPGYEEEDGAEGSFKAIAGGYAAAAAVFLIVFGLLLVMKNQVYAAWPATALIYNLAGSEVPVKGQGMIIDRLAATTMTDGQGVLILNLQGQIINLQSSENDVPALRATLLDEGGEKIESWLIYPEQTMIEGENTLEFKSEYPALPGEAASVNVSFSPFAGRPQTKTVDQEKEHAEEKLEEQPEEHPSLH